MGFSIRCVGCTGHGEGLSAEEWPNYCSIHKQDAQFRLGDVISKATCFYRPLKIAWRQTLDSWKQRCKRKSQTLSKDAFPQLLGELLEKLCGKASAHGTYMSDNLKSGFEATGICPFNPDRVQKKLPQEPTDPVNQPASICGIWNGCRTAQEYEMMNQHVVRSRNWMLHLERVFHLKIFSQAPVLMLAPAPVPTTSERERQKKLRRSCLYVHRHRYQLSIHARWRNAHQT